MSVFSQHTIIMINNRSNCRQHNQGKWTVKIHRITSQSWNIQFCNLNAKESWNKMRKLIGFCGVIFLSWTTYTGNHYLPVFPVIPENLFVKYLVWDINSLHSPLKLIFLRVTYVSQGKLALCDSIVQNKNRTGLMFCSEARPYCQKLSARKIQLHFWYLCYTCLCFSICILNQHLVGWKLSLSCQWYLI